jgi:PAS domain S-box-containing protein
VNSGKLEGNDSSYGIGDVVESGVYLQEFFTHAPDAMFLANENGIVVAWNRAAERLFDLPAQNVTGKSVADVQVLLAPLVSGEAFLLQQSWSEFHTGGLSRLSGEVHHPDKPVIYVEQTIFPVPSPSGLCLACILRDVTHEHLHEQREERRHSLLEQVIQLGKRVSRITNLQQCYAEIYQCIQKGLGFDRVGLFTYDSVEQRVQGVIGTERTGELGSKAHVVQLLKPGDTWNEILASPQGIHFVDNSQTTEDVGDNMVGVQENIVIAAWAGETPVGFIAVDNLLTGVSFTPEQVEALQLFAGYAGLAIQNARWNEEMEQRVTDRTAALEAANRELESLSSTIAHDLRSPLRAVVGYSQILSEANNSLEWDREAVLQKIHGEGRRMGHMVDDFLAFLRLGRVPLDKKSVNMNALVQEVIDAIRRENPTLQVTFALQMLPNCRADRSLLFQVLAELLTNAIQFTMGCAEPRIEIGAAFQEGEIRYFVRDNGVGFNMEYADRLFGIFERLYSTNDSSDVVRTGIGLANVRRIISRHGGRVWAESAEGEGATFYFTL